MTATQDFEKVAAQAEAAVAQFDERPSLLMRLQHFLHGNPAMVPLIVLAAVAGDIDTVARGFLIAGVVLGAVGDIALLDPSERRFMAGLGALRLSTRRDTSSKAEFSPITYSEVAR